MRPELHIGVLVPWANMVVEAELPRLAPGNVVFHYARLVPRGRTTALNDQFLRGLEAAVPGAVAQLAELPLRGIVMACTSAGFAGHAGGMINAFDALVETLKRMGAARIVLATPYPRHLTNCEAEAFIERGISVDAGACLDRDDGFAGMTATEIHALVDRIPRPALARADALVLSCTGWPTLGVIGELEDTLGIPVLSSNLAIATIWSAYDDLRPRVHTGEPGRGVGGREGGGRGQP